MATVPQGNEESRGGQHSGGKGKREGREGEREKKKEKDDITSPGHCSMSLK